MSATGTRSEMACVAFSFARASNSVSILGSVCGMFNPFGLTMSLPLLITRSNSRCVCRRPAGVAYQLASSALDLKLGISVDLRRIGFPFVSVHVVSGDSAEQLPAHRDNDHEIAAGDRPPEQHPAFLAFDSRRCNTNV